MTLGTLTWIHEEQRGDYSGGFPVGFEDRLMFLLGLPEEYEVLHLFGGKAEHGLRIDVNKRVDPDILGDAHSLSIRDGSYRVVMCDPPYTDSDNQNLYDNDGRVFLKKWLPEAVRVCKHKGFIVTRHIRRMPVPSGCREWMNVVLMLNAGRMIHLCQVFIKTI